MEHKQSKWVSEWVRENDSPAEFSSHFDIILNGKMSNKQINSKMKHDAWVL